MRYAVDFDNQLSIEGHEIDDISIDGVLAPEFSTGQSAIA